MEIPVFFKRILIVDDDPGVLEGLHDFLETAGYECNSFLEAQDSIDAVQDGTYDLAIVDLHLGKKNGLEVMKSFHEAIPDMPVIILTGYGTVESAVEAMDLGAFNYLTKPFKRGELLFQVKQALENSRLHAEIRNLKETSRKHIMSDLICIENATGVRVKPYHEAYNEFESLYLIHLIDINAGDIKKAARSAELPYDDFLQLLKKHDIGFKDS